MTDKIRRWNPDDGDALQGDVCLFRIPDHIAIDTTDEVVRFLEEQEAQSDETAGGSGMTTAYPLTWPDHIRRATAGLHAVGER